MKSGIYIIINILNGKIYVGSAKNLSKRIIQHKSNLVGNRHCNLLLQNSWNKYGSSAFEFRIVEYCDKQQLIEREQFHIDNLKSAVKEFGYNLRPIAKNNAGRITSEETKLKLSLAMKGRKFSKEHVKNISAARIGIKLSKEHIKNMSLARKGKIVSDETKLKIGLQSRDINKWPCVDGSYCKCEKCNAKKAAYMKNKRKEGPQIIEELK